MTCRADGKGHRIARLFEDRVIRTDGCWLWDGSHNTHGYGQWWNPTTKSLQFAHVEAWERENGPVGNATLDHVCRNHGCVRPSHLEPVTFRENVLRGVGPTAQNARKTHCAHGHEFTPENTVVVSKKAGGRKCRTCMNRLQRERYARKAG
jgi:hypothetical protein